MPQDKTSICNMALGHIGVISRIQDVENENSAEAAACRLYYDQCLDLLLEMRPWACAERQAALQDIGDPPDEWGYRYMYPNTCKLAVKIVNPSLRNAGRGYKIKFKVVSADPDYGRAILTDQEEAILLYNHAIDDPALFDATFIQAFTLFLAQHIAMPLRVDPKITQYVAGQAAIWINDAAAKSMGESEPDDHPESEFQTARA